MTEAAKESYEKLFKMLDLCQQRNLIAPDARWSVACGELAIHPYRERILDMVRDKRVTFHSNCFKFDDRIAEHLSRDPESVLSFSIDAGTPEAWINVKGFDNYETAVTHLKKYAAHCIYPNQIWLKYILLPGVNDTQKDFENVVSLMNQLGITALTISRDLDSHAESFPEEKAAAAKLMAMCFQSGINTSSGLLFPQDEKLEIKSMAWELLQNK